MDDLPKPLAENYAHWLDLSSGHIKLRPLADPLESPNKTWQILCKNGYWVLHQESSRLISIHSSTFHMISVCLKPLEYPQNIIITSSPDGSLLIDLPRFRLSFIMKENLLESRDLLGMVIDTDQSTGTMYGLSSQLVLCSKDSILAQLPRSRRVIIPHGKPDPVRQGNHIKVYINTKSQSNVRYHLYDIDTDLGRLISNVSLASKLYKVYLHAITSHCLADPLTGRMGMEEALGKLRSASCLSFQRLEPAEEDALREIGTLTPDRRYYPDDKKIMQRVIWHSVLSPIAQHPEFQGASQVILEYGERLRIFDGNHEIDDPVDKSNHFLECDTLRTTAFYPAEISGCPLSGSADIPYLARDHVTNKDLVDILKVSKMVYNWCPQLYTSKQLLETLKCWQKLGGNVAVSLSLLYHRDWLQINLGEWWFTLYESLRGCHKDEHRFPLMFSLSTLAYSSPDSRNLMPTLLAFAVVPGFRVCKLSPPKWVQYDLTKGSKPQDLELRELACSFGALPVEDRGNLPRVAKSETSPVPRIQSEELVRILMDQWPTSAPKLPPDLGSSYFQKSRFMVAATVLFQTCFQNWDLCHHIGLVQIELDKADTYQEGKPVTPISEYKSPPYATTVHTEVSYCVELEQLFTRAPPHIDPFLSAPRTMETPVTRADTDKLESLLLEFKRRQNSNLLNKKYADNLENSRCSLDKQNIQAPPGEITIELNVLISDRDQYRKHIQDVFAVICRSLSPSNSTEEVMSTAGLWPCLTMRSILNRLASSSSTGQQLKRWKEVLISFAQGMLLFQHSQRLIHWYRQKDDEQFYKELENRGDTNLYAAENPDWLLIQVRALSSLSHYYYY